MWCLVRALMYFIYGRTCVRWKSLFKPRRIACAQYIFFIAVLCKLVHIFVEQNVTLCVVYFNSARVTRFLKGEKCW